MWKLDWRYGRKKNGIYIDGHKWEDVLHYRDEFLKRWKEYEKCMVTYNNQGNVNSTPTGFPIPQGQRFCFVVVTHDESMFYVNDHCKNMWNHISNKATPGEPQGAPSRNNG